MRNWASAAHPNQAELTGLNLVSWLETCIKEVISTPLSSTQIQINQLLRNIKNIELTSEDAEKMSSFFTELNSEKCDSLAKGFFGIYIDKNTQQETISNINLLAPDLWVFVSEEVRSEFGIRCATFTANGEKDAEKKSKRFLEVVKGLSYLPDNVKIPQFKRVIEQLLEAHNNLNNFYNEPPLARELRNLIGNHGAIPLPLSYFYIKTLVSVYLTNGNGVAWNAEPLYAEMLKKLDVTQTYLAFTAFRESSIRSKLQFSKCKDKFSEMLNLLENNITSEGMRELFEEIRRSLPQLADMDNKSRLMEKIEKFDKSHNTF